MSRRMEIKPRVEHEYSDGSWRGFGDVPWNVSRTGRTRVVGYNVGYRFFATHEEACDWVACRGKYDADAAWERHLDWIAEGRQ